MKNKLLFSVIFVVLLSKLVFATGTSSYSVLFETNSSEVGKSEKAALAAFIQNLDSVDIISISLFGYCDDIGTENDNKVLSDNRVSSVKNVLLSLKISNDIFSEMVGKGELPLKPGGEVEELRRLNRRVDLEVVYKIRQRDIPPPVVNVVEEEKEKEKSDEKTEIEDKFNNSKVGDKIVFNNILFESNLSNIRSVSYSALEELTSILKKNPQITINIQGHVCCGKSDGVDLDTGLRNLSESRAKAVYTYLVKNNIDASRLRYEGMAGKYPTGRGDEADKRVEIVITGKGEDN